MVLGYLNSPSLEEVRGMADVVKISEAASLALHTMLFLGCVRDRTVSAKEIAGRLGVSEARLSEVMRRLVDAGIVLSERSPGGGFALGKGAAEATLPEVLKAMEGDVPPRSACWKGARAGRGAFPGNVQDSERGGARVPCGEEASPACRGFRR